MMDQYEQAFWKDAEVKGRHSRTLDYKKRLVAALSEFEAEREKVRVLREALERIAAGRHYLGWSPCSAIADKALATTKEQSHE